MASTFESLLDYAVAGKTFQIDKSWGQGRTVFGGLSAALLMQAMERENESTRPLRVANVSFVGPLQIEKDAIIQVEHLRDGKNVTHMTARILQEEATCVFATACFAKDRTSSIQVDNTQLTQLTPPEKANFIPQIPGVTPKFLRHVKLSMSEGKLPFTGSSLSHIKGWMAFKEPQTRLSPAHVIALADAWPPTVLQKLRWPKPASTLAWQFEFLTSNLDLSGDNWLAIEAYTQKADAGYVHCEATIFDQSGRPILLSRQTDTVFD